MADVYGVFRTDLSPYKDEYISGLATLINPNLTITWDLFLQGPTLNTVKHKWYDAPVINIKGEVGAGGWDATATTALPIDAGLAVNIQIGDQLHVENEIVIVKAINARTTAPTIDVYSRGWGTTTGAIHAATTPIYATGQAMIEGEVETDRIKQENLARSNFFQRQTEQIEITKTAELQAYLDVNSALQDAQQQALARLLRKANRQVILGEPVDGDGDQPRTCGGLKYFIQYKGGFSKSAGGQITEDLINDVMQEVSERGGTPNTLLVAPREKRILNDLFKDQIRYERTETTAGNAVQIYESVAGPLRIVTDPAMTLAGGEAYFLNTAMMEKYFFEGGQIELVDEPSLGNSERKVQSLKMHYSVKVKDTGTHFGRLYGLTA